MIISKLVLNPGSRKVQRDISDVQEMHRTLMSVFRDVQSEGDNIREQLGVLHRVEHDRLSGCPILLVQSKVQPDWSLLPPGFLDLNINENPQTKDVKEVYKALTNGMTMVFRLRANPTRKIMTKSGPDGRRNHGSRVDLRREADQLGWLERKGRQHGFDLISISTSPDVPDVRISYEENIRKVVGMRKSPSKSMLSKTSKKRLTFGSVLFEGRLRISDIDRFREALNQGIGPGKAYGFGLLSVAPSHR